MLRLCSGEVALRPVNARCDNDESCGSGGNIYKQMDDGCFYSLPLDEHYVERGYVEVGYVGVGNVVCPGG